MRRRAAAVLAALLALAGVFGIGSSAGTGRGPAQAVGSSLTSVAPGASGRVHGSRARADIRPGAEVVVGGPAASHAVSAHGPVPGVVAETFVPPAARHSIIVRAAVVQAVAGVPRGAVPGRAPPNSTGF
jgi:hypothetical protein